MAKTECPKNVPISTQTMPLPADVHIKSVPHKK